MQAGEGGEGDEQLSAAQKKRLKKRKQKERKEMEEAGLLPASAPPTTEKQEGEEPEAEDVSVWQFLRKLPLECVIEWVLECVSAHTI